MVEAASPRTVKKCDKSGDMPKLKLWHSVRRGGTVGLQVVRLQDALARKEHYASKLETLLRARTAQIDELTGRLQRSQEQIRQLDQECEHLVEMVKLT
jgi:hypothetical protein